MGISGGCPRFELKQGWMIFPEFFSKASVSNRTVRERTMQMSTGVIKKTPVVSVFKFLTPAFTEENMPL
jgi:hypothetical protein